MTLWLVWIAFLRRVWRQAGTELSVPCPLSQPSVPSFKVIVRSGRLTKNDLALGGHNPYSIHVFLGSLATQTRWRFSSVGWVAEGKMSRVPASSRYSITICSCAFRYTACINWKEQPRLSTWNRTCRRPPIPPDLYHLLVISPSLAGHQHKQKWHCFRL